MIWREDLLRQIEETLSILTVRVKLSNSQGRTDINSHAEDFYCGLLNIVLGTNLKNLNLLQMDFPAVDLADGDAGLCVQVTSTEARSKITKTLEKFFRHELDKKYGRLIVLMIGVKDTYRDTFKVEREFDFDPDRDIWDTPHLLDEITRLNDETLEKVANYLREKLKLYTEEQSVLLNLPLRTAMNENNFVGRERELDEIAERFGRHEKIVVLSGLGGMGKTELAVRFGRDYANSGAGRAYFVNFRKDFFHTVTDEISLGIEGLTEQKLDEDAKFRTAMKVLNKCAGDDLLIIDNADTEEASFEQLRRELSVLPTRILITTRCDAVGAIDVDSLHREELHRIFRLYADSISEADMDALIDAVDAHTLTVDLMARSLRPGRRAATPEKLLTALNKRDLTSESFMKVATNYPGGLKQARINEHLRTVFRVVELSVMEQVVLLLATLLPDGGMDDELFMFPLKEEMQDVLDELIEKGWLLWKDTLLKIHPVIRIVCEEILKPNDDNCGFFLVRLAEWYEPNNFDKDKIYQLAELFSHVADDFEDARGDWALFAGRFWYELGELRKALDYNLKNVTKREQNQQNLQELAIAYNNVSSAYYGLGEYSCALEYLKKSEMLNEKHSFSDSSGVAGIYSNIGLVYIALGDHKRALEYGLKAVEICENLLPLEQRELAVSYDTVARAYGMLGDNELELEYMMRAMSISKKVLSPENPDLAAFYNNVGSAYMNKGDYERAQEYALKALAINEKSLPSDHYHMVVQYSNIAVTYAQMNDFVTASEYADRALEKAERSMKEHPDFQDYWWRAEVMKKCASLQEQGIPFDNPFKPK